MSLRCAVHRSFGAQADGESDELKPGLPPYQPLDDGDPEVSLRCAPRSAASARRRTARATS